MKKSWRAPILKVAWMAVATLSVLPTLPSHSMSIPGMNILSQKSQELDLDFTDRFPEAFFAREIDFTLRSQAKSHDFFIGSAVNVKVLNQDFLYRYSLAREFNMVTAENQMKFKHLHPEPHRFDFTEADLLMAFATAHQMMIRGHTLVWHNALPDWLIEGNWKREELIAILRSYIKTVVGRYQGQIMVWDVVNEAIADDGSLRDSFWLKGIGPEYIEMAFHWAHEANPKAILIYNDYGGEGLNRKSDAIYQLVKSLKERDVPIHGVGLQMHLRLDSPPSSLEVGENMIRLANLGLEVQITEMDVRIRQPSTAQDYEQQAKIYQEMLHICLLASNCNTFVTWGFSDRHSWIPSHFEGWGDALLFDRAYRPKPAYYELQKELAKYHLDRNY
ncbi:MAG: endo-1,4-beta-xylanase [Xenococcaceae cyanobacterium MO_188.B32]|nr:endo-1,4-beta-xylanase [Xenococcaceae cyanobacterium MO_188.B32]